MRKLSEIKDEEAMEVLAEILDPASVLIADEEFKEAVRGSKEKKIKPDRMKAVKIAITKHRDEIVKIMALLDGTPVEDFHYNVLTLPQMVLSILNDKELISFFSPQAENNSKESSGSAMVNTEGDQSISSNM